jgi:hypothetical protein
MFSLDRKHLWGLITGSGRKKDSISLHLKEDFRKRVTLFDGFCGLEPSLQFKKW